MAAGALLGADRPCLAHAHGLRIVGVGEARAAHVRGRGRGHDGGLGFGEHVREHAAIEVVHVVEPARRATVALGLAELDAPRFEALETDAAGLVVHLHGGHAAKERVAARHVRDRVHALGGEEALEEKAKALGARARRVVASGAHGLREHLVADDLRVDRVEYAPVLVGDQGLLVNAPVGAAFAALRRELHAVSLDVARPCVEARLVEGVELADGGPHAVQCCPRFRRE